jgi:protein-S-isoprenylcysteine O-methyltransferase Ste14
MSRLPRAQPTRHLAVATLGGLTFVASLVYFGLSYAGRYGVDFGPFASRSPLVPVAVDSALFTTFALHHSIFARTGLKAAVARVLPATLERSAYVWVASLLFIGVCALWQPIAGVAWRLVGLWRVAGFALQLAAGVVTLVAARQLGMLRLAGIQQVITASDPDAAATLDDSGLYGFVRHPIYLAWLVLVWAAPDMTDTRVAFAALSSAYLVIAVPFEEQDLCRLFGSAYTDYSRRVRWRIVPLVY